ncbi:hypothetical protein SprV_0200763900 [Sparganum proliferum]
MRSLSPIPPRTLTTESRVEKDLDNCTHMFVRCACVCQPLDSSHEPPFRVLARNTKTDPILSGDREDLVSFDWVMAAVVDEPPDLHQVQDCADPYPVILQLPNSLTSHSPFAFDPNSSNFTGIRYAISIRVDPVRGVLIYSCMSRIFLIESLTGNSCSSIKNWVKTHLAY